MKNSIQKFNFNKKFHIKHLCFFLILFVFISCSYKVDREFNKNDLKYVEWINPNKELLFVSNSQDSVFYKILEPNDNYIECGGPTSCSSDTFIRDFKYEKTTNDTTYTYKFASVSKRKHSTNTTIEFEGTFKYLYNSENSLSDYMFNGILLKDVLIDDAVYHNASMEEQKCPKKIWWSNSYGIVKYETRDNKIWERILN